MREEMAGVGTEGKEMADGRWPVAGGRWTAGVEGRQVVGVVRVLGQPHTSESSIDTQRGRWMEGWKQI